MHKLRNMKLFSAGVFSLLVLFSSAPVAASSANISHAFHASGQIPSGSIVSLDKSQTGYVDLANTNNGLLIEGVAASANESLLAVDPSSTTVQVATSGSVNTLVSTLNGDIKVGDQIAVSPFNGVGMVALPGSHTVGLAETAFNSATQGASEQQVSDNKGKVSQIWFGYVRLSISIGADTAIAAGQEQDSLQKLAKNLTGHDVSPFRLVISLIVASVAILLLITLIYASIYGTIVSVGRNPLARYDIFRSLASVIAMALVVAALASVTIFFLLK